jgi:hypothetical protein
MNQEQLNNSFTLRHGIGDGFHFCHLAQLYLKRNIPFAVVPCRDQEWFFKACGIPVLEEMPQHRKRVNHTWSGPGILGTPLQNHPWQCNKTAGNLEYPHPLPRIREPINALWYELLDVRLNINIPTNLAQPYILTHTRGHSNPHLKNIGEHEEELFRTLLDKGQTVVHLDWHHETKFKAEGFIDVCREDSITLERLVGLIHGARGMIGIDSGPCHFARLNYELPTVQVWVKYAPSHYALPRPKLLALTDQFHPLKKWNDAKKKDFNIHEVEVLSGKVIAETLLSLLQSP